MTQTLTTEQLKERIGHLKERLRDMKQHKYPDDCPNATAYLESLKAERQQDIELLEELLANREAQPVAYIGAQMLEDLTDGARGCGRVWASSKDVLSGDDRLALYTAPPAPAVPDFGSLTKLIVGRLIDCGAAGDDSIADAETFVYNACRAAMLAAAPEGGN